MAIGAAAVAIGTMVGCALPNTDAEDGLMGETRDNVMSRAGDAFHDAAESVSNLIEKARTDERSKPASRSASKSSRSRNGRRQPPEASSRARLRIPGLGDRTSVA